MKEAIFIALIEANPIQREGIASFLRNGGFESCHYFKSIHELYGISQPEQQRLVFLIDFEREDEALVASIEELHGRFPGCVVIVLANDAGDPVFAQAFKSDADGLLLKRIDQDVLVKSLELMLLGERVFPVERPLKSDSNKIHIDDNNIEENDGLDKLSSRERDVLISLVSGNSNKTIARLLGISEATVKVHVKSILRKTLTKNRTQAAVFGAKDRSAL